MPSWSCTCRPYKKENDEEIFLRDYVKLKTDELARIFEKKDVNTGAADVNEAHHPVLDLQEIMTIVFEKLDKPDKKNMAEAYRGWAKWFIVGTETSKVKADYKKQLVRGNEGGVITIKRGYTLVERYCACSYYKTKREKRSYHTELERFLAKMEYYDVPDDGASGSEGYYDSDC